MAPLDFVHVFEPPTDQNAPILLLLHGTGGNEQDLLSLAEILAPDAGVLSPRGKVLERGMPRFFRRLAEGVFDVEDLKFRTGELADFVLAAATHYGFDVGRLVAAASSNGANMPASMLLLRPDALTAGILIRAMVPLVPDPLPSLPRTRGLVSNGTLDPIVSADVSERLAKRFCQTGADVTLGEKPAGDELTQWHDPARREGGSV